MINASDMLLLSDDTSAPELILAGNRRRRPANKAGQPSLFKTFSCQHRQADIKPRLGHPQRDPPQASTCKCSLSRAYRRRQDMVRHTLASTNDRSGCL